MEVPARIATSTDWAAAGAARLDAYAPDLPGFGASAGASPLPIAAHARYVVEWLDQLGIERCTLGFSMGGGVALELYRLAPERVASVVLLSSIGVGDELLDTAAQPRTARRPARRALVPASAILISAR
jgi:pimeloyl-ACP methyl ester carboxylesterase